jgi:ABC-type multidrug transport system permease subunit
MFYRSLDKVWFAVISPFLTLAIMALVKHLQFAFAHGTSRVGFLTFTAIRWAAFIAAHFNQDGTVGDGAGYRAEGVLKRIAATPMSLVVFITAQVSIRVVVGLAQTIAFLAMAVAAGVHIGYTPDLVWIVPLAAITLLTGTGFGFAIAGLTNSPEAANQLNIGLVTPVFLLAGVQYPLAGLPGVLPHLAEYLVPFAAPVQAFREAVAGHLAGDFPRLIAIALGWLASALMLAARNYRLVEDSA